MEIRKLLGIIWRRKWIILQAFLVVFLTAVIGSHLVTPVYESSAKTLIKTSTTASSLLANIGLEDLSSILSSTETDLDTYIELGTVAPLLESVIEKLQIRDGSGRLMKPDRLKRKSILSAILPHPYVEISQIEDADLLEIKAISSDPEETAMIANTLAEIFIQDNLMRIRQEYTNARSFIEERIQLERANYLSALETIKDFQLRENTVDLETETKLGLNKIVELMKEKEDNIIDLAEVSAKIKTLKSQFERHKKIPVSNIAIRENPQIEELSKTLSVLEVQLAGELAEKTPEHPEIKALSEKIQKTREELRVQTKISQESSVELEALERDLAALEVHLEGVNADIRRYTSMLETIPEKGTQLAQLQLKLTINEKLYSSLLEYLYQIGIAEAMTVSDVTLVEPAVAPEPSHPKGPNKMLNSLMGAFLGLILGLGLAFLINHLDDTLKTPEDIKGYGLILLGTVPMFRRRERGLISGSDPKGYVSESYRTVRNSLKFISLDKRMKTIVVTSCLENEGKTTTLVNLGISLCRDGKSVLIIDADLRKPRMHEVLGSRENSVGISTVLSGEATATQAIQHTHVEGLHLLSSGPVPPDPGSMVESEKIRQLIRDLSPDYDVVLLDTPPILAAGDAVVLAKDADAMLLVLESERITRRSLSQCLDLLKRAGVHPAGAILNKYRIMQRSTYYRYYNAN
jgi:polysaccharide biosynthesis transport protein